MVAAAVPKVTTAARFDYYSTTIMESPQRVIEVLSARLHGAVVVSRPQIGGYDSAVTIKAGDVTLATVYYGGTFEWPYAFASSDETDAFVALVREVWPADHAVTRMDCAIDFDSGPGTFEALMQIVTAVADGPDAPADPLDLRRRASKVSVRHVGDWHRQLDGRTLYLGSTKSAVMLRLYEKGIEIRQRSHMARPDIPVSLVRLELQVRPTGRAKRAAALCDPLAAFGYSDWSRELLRRVELSDVERVHIRERRASDHERAMRWVTHQYRKHFIHAAELAGGWEQLGEALRARIMDAKHGEMPDDDATPDADAAAFAAEMGDAFAAGFWDHNADVAPGYVERAQREQQHDVADDDWTLERDWEWRGFDDTPF